MAATVGVPTAAAQTAPTAATVINAGTTSWVQAARSGHADMLVIGDSVVWFGGHGWDAGLTAAARNEFGLAGTGLTVSSSFAGEGEGFGAYGEWNGWNTTWAAVPAAHRDYVWSKHADPSRAAVSSGPGPTSMFGWGVEGSVLPSNAAYDFHVWSASTGGSMGAFRRSGATFARLGPAVPAVPTAGYQHTTFSLPANANTERQEIFLENVTNTSVLYSRLVRPGATGATVTSWGYGGRSTLDFYNDLYVPMPAVGRQAMLKAIVEGGSGKLNVVLAEGFNDRNETSPSVNGVPNGSSPQAFRDNVSALIGVIRSDWNTAGLNPADLSFTLLGMYEINQGNAPLRAYAAELQSLAGSDSALSFVDLHQLAPSYQQAAAQGYITDGLHLERSGALLYGDVLIDAIVPEPGLLALPAGFFLLLARRRR